MEETKRKKIIIIGSFSFLLLFLITFILWALGIFPSRVLVLKEKLLPSTPNNVEFSFRKCSSTQECVGDFNPYVNETKWLDGSTFYARITIPANYGDVFWTGDYEVTNNNTLTLEYGTIKGAFMACGYCPVELEYRINNIPNEEYQIMLKQY